MNLNLHQKKTKRTSRKIVLRKSKGYAKKYLKVSVVLITLFSLGLYFTFSPKFKIGNLEILGTKKFVSKDDMHEISKNQAFSKNIFFYNAPDLKATLEKNFLGAKNIVVKKKLPNTLEITITERLPITIVYQDQSENHFLVDESGYVLGIVDDSYPDLPMLFYSGELFVGKVIASSVIPSFIIVTKLTDEADLKATSVSFSDKYLNVYLENDILLLFDVNKDIKYGFEIVKSILSKMLTEDLKVKKIDLRYDKVIVSFIDKTYAQG